MSGRGCMFNDHDHDHDDNDEVCELWDLVASCHQPTNAMDQNTHRYIVFSERNAIRRSTSMSRLHLDDEMILISILRVCVCPSSRLQNEPLPAIHQPSDRVWHGHEPSVCKYCDISREMPRFLPFQKKTSCTHKHPHPHPHPHPRQTNQLYCVFRTGCQTQQIDFRSGPHTLAHPNTCCCTNTHTCVDSKNGNRCVCVCLNQIIVLDSKVCNGFDNQFRFVSFHFVLLRAIRTNGMMTMVILE